MTARLNVFFIFLFLFFSTAAVRADPPLIFAAASTTNLMEAFIEAHGQTIRASFASSSVLAKQITKGAPAGLFVSANIRWMEYLEQKDLLVPGTRKDLLANRLVVIAPKTTKIPEGLNAQEVLSRFLNRGRLALGDPNHVPAGIYAKEALEEIGLWEDLSPHLAPMHHVRAALTMVERGECPLGIVYASDALISERVQVVATFAAKTHQPITYQVALIRGHDAKPVQEFYRFITSPDHEELLKRYSFTKP